MKKILLAFSLIWSHTFFSSLNTISFDDLCSFGNPQKVKLSQPFINQNTGFAIQIGPDPLYGSSGLNQNNRFYVFSNPYNRINDGSPTRQGWYQVVDSVQPLARSFNSLPTSDPKSPQWLIFIVPFFVDPKTNKIIKHFSKITPKNPADVWVAVYGGFKKLYFCQKVSDTNPSPTNSDVSSMTSQLTYDPTGKIYLKVYNPPYTKSASVALSVENDAFAVSPFDNALLNDRINKSARKDIIADYPNFVGIMNALGQSGAQAMRLLLAGIQQKKLNTISKEFYDTSLPENWFLSTQLLSKVSSLFTSGTLPYQGLNSFSMSGWSQVARDYVKVHLSPALQALSSAVNIVSDSNGKNISVNFDAASFNGVVINAINNNTKSNFSIFQGSGQNFTKIGTLKPGANSVALYGAASGQGDIVFVSDNSNMGTFRVSFKTGSDIMALTQSGDATSFSYGASGPSSGDDFLCVQMKKGVFPAGDFPQGTAEQEQEMVSRTHCIDLSQLTNPAYVTLRIEDSMTVEQGGENIVIDQTKIPMFYASIESVQLLKNAYVPYFSTPYYVSSSHLTAWFEFLNMVMGSLGSNYTKLYSPTDVSNNIKNAKTLFVLKKQGEDYGDLKTGITGLKDPKAYGLNYTSKNTGYVVSGLPGTEYLFTADIPSKDSLQAKLNPPKPVTKPKDDKKSAKAPIEKNSTAKPQQSKKQKLTKPKSQKLSKADQIKADQEKIVQFQAKTAQLQADIKKLQAS